MKDVLKVCMDKGPHLFSFRDGIAFYGAYHLLNFTEADRGKELKIEVNSGNKPVCWIELWPSAYDGQDWLKWVTKRGEDPLVRTGDRPQPNPSFSWKVEPGTYTVYFVASSFDRDYVGHDEILFTIEVC